MTRATQYTTTDEQECHTLVQHCEPMDTADDSAFQWNIDTEPISIIKTSVGNETSKLAEIEVKIVKILTNSIRFKRIVGPFFAKKRHAQHQVFKKINSYTIDRLKESSSCSVVKELVSDKSRLLELFRSGAKTACAQTGVKFQNLELCKSGQHDILVLTFSLV